jgi:hypothetical protein
MRTLKLTILLLLFAASSHAQAIQQSISLPVRTSIYCKPPNGYLGSTCRYPYVLAGTTGVVVARTDSPIRSANIWTNEGLEAMLFMYAGTWDFISGAIGDYANQNAALGAQNGEGYDKNYTMPVEAMAGDMLIGFSDANSTGGHLAKAGFGFQIEQSDGLMAVEDMIAPTEGVYIGSLIWKQNDGYDSGGTHWLMGVAVYRKRTQ